MKNLILNIQKLDVKILNFILKNNLHIFGILMDFVKH